MSEVEGKLDKGKGITEPKIGGGDVNNDTC